MIDIKILVIEDEQKLLNLVEKYLKRENYIVYTAKSGKEAYDVFYESKIDLVILDLMLPDVSGYEICEQFRKYSDIPIIMLTARSSIEDKLDGFSKGADDYVTKPFSPRELIARVKVLLKRFNHIIKEDVYEHGNFKFDVNTYNAYCTGENIDFSPGEIKLLYYFILNRNITLPRDQILRRIWGDDYDGDIRAVDTRIKRMREKLECADISITTVRGIGYRWEEK
ncbi:MAG: response regulator transcription factor [Clostridia bacterium]